VRFAPGPLDTNLALKKFLRKHVYYTPTLIEERRQSSSRIAELFQYFLDHPSALGQREDSGPRHRVICDYIAGMTDGFFRRTYADLIGA
jgi:dGTPase